MPEPIISLGANDFGMVRVNGQPMAKGRPRPYQFGDYSKLTVFDDNGTLLIGAIPFDEIINDETGDPFASADDLQTFVEENFFEANTGGGGASDPVTLTGPTWDGTNGEFVLTEDLDLILDSDTAFCYARFVNMGGYNLTVNGEAIAINAVGTNGGITGVGFAKCVDGTYDVEKGMTMQNIPAPPAPDETEPSPLSYTIEDAAPSDLVVVFDEALDDTSVPAPGDFTSLLGKTFTVDITGDELTLTADTPYENGDIEQVTYTPGANKIKDIAGNNALAFDSDDNVDGVVNNVSASGAVASYPWIMRYDPANGKTSAAGYDRTIDMVNNPTGVGLNAHDLRSNTGVGFTIEPAFINGLDVFKMDLGSQLNTTLGASINYPLTLMGLIKITSVIGSGIDYASSLPGFGVFFTGGSGKWFIYQNNAAPTSVGNADTSPHVFCYTIASNGAMAFYLDDPTTPLMADAAAGAAAGSAIGQLDMGDAANGATDKYFGDYLLADHVVDLSNRTAMMDELKTKWGI